MFGFSWYSSLVTYILVKVANELKIEPPIQVEYLRSGWEYIFILTSFGARFFNSVNNLSQKPNFFINYKKHKILYLIIS